MTYPSIEQFQPVTTEQPWGTETLIAETPQYTGKVLFYKAGHAGGFQYHVEKDETFYLHSGLAHIGWVEAGRIKTRYMHPGESVHIPAGAPHRFKAVDDCIVFEASTPHKNDRVNVSEEFGLPDPPGTLPSTWARELDGTHLRLTPIEDRPDGVVFRYGRPYCAPDEHEFYTRCDNCGLEAGSEGSYSDV